MTRSKAKSASAIEQSPADFEDEMKAIVCEVEIDILDDAAETFKTEHFEGQFIQDPGFEAKPTLPETDSNVQVTEQESVVQGVRTLRNSAARATELLRSMLNNRDAYINEDDAKSDSSYDSEIGEHVPEIRIRKPRKSRR